MSLCKKMECCLSSLPLALWGILLLSLVIGLTGLEWGAPHFQHPDEFIRVILTLRQNKSPNPHYFNNPVLPIYLGAIPLVPYYLYLMLFRPELLSSFSSLSPTAESLSSVPTEFMTNVILLVRLMSVLVSLASLVVVYLVAERVFSRRTALLSCFLLALSPLFIPHAKYATVEIYLLLFFWLSLLFQQRYLEHGSQKDLLLSAVFVGLAMASKYIGIFGIFFLAVAVLLRARPRSLPEAIASLLKKDVMKAGLLVGIVFLIANPWPVLAFHDVFGAFLHEHMFDIWGSGVRKAVWNPSTPTVRGWITYPKLAFVGLTPALFVLAIIGFIMLLIQIKHERSLSNTPGMLPMHLLLWVFTYYALFVGPWVNSYSRYLVPIVPALLIFAAVVLERLWVSAGVLKAVGRVAVVLVVAFAVLNAGMVLYEFTHDTRSQAGKWLEDNLNRDDNIGFFAQQDVYLPPFPEGVEVTFFPYVYNVSIPDEEFAEQAAALLESGPEYLVLTSAYYKRFYGKQPTVRTEFYDEFINGIHPTYIPVARFERTAILGYQTPADDLMSPTIIVLKRE